MSIPVIARARHDIRCTLQRQAGYNCKGARWGEQSNGNMEEASGRNESTSFDSEAGAEEEHDARDHGADECRQILRPERKLYVCPVQKR